MTLNPKIVQKVKNLNYVQDLNPFSLLSSISAFGLELWSITEKIYFDNFLITKQETVGLDFARQISEFGGNKTSESKKILKCFFRKIFNLNHFSGKCHNSRRDWNAFL